MLVIATAKGYFGKVREVGERFDVPDDTSKASWFEPVRDPPEQSKPAKQGKGQKPDPDADPI